MPARLVPGKFKRGALHSGSKHGPVVTSRPQMLAIMLSEKRDEEAGKVQRNKPNRRKS